MSAVCSVAGWVVICAGLISCFVAWPTGHVGNSDILQTLVGVLKASAVDYLFTGLFSGILLLALSNILAKLDKLILRDSISPEPSQQAGVPQEVDPWDCPNCGKQMATSMTKCYSCGEQKP